jgi:DNA-binding MarR family transcriptional regulator
MDFETCEVSFDCVMPSAIFFNEAIEPGSIRCYAIIRNLSKMNGYCFATNKYLSCLLNAGLSSIKRWIASLEEQGFIEIEHLPNFAQDQRRLFISDKFKKVLRRSKNDLPPVQNCTTPSPKMGHIIEEEYKEDKLKETISPIVPKGDHPPRKSKKEEKIQRATEVWTTPTQDEDIIRRCSQKRISSQACYDKLSAWKIGKSITGGKNDYKAIVDWVIEAVEKDKTNTGALDKNKELAEKIIQQFPLPVSKNHIQLQDKGFVFTYGREYEFIEFTDFGFRDRVLNRLRKMNLVINNL